MKREKISFIYADAQSYADQEITVCGWVRTVRDMKNFGFIELVLNKSEVARSSPLSVKKSVLHSLQID